MGIMEFLDDHSSHGGAIGAIIRAVIRFFQFILAIVVCALYGVDLQNAHRAHSYTDGRWVFAEVVAGLAAVTTIVYAVPFVKSYWAFGWDWILFILWTALFGLFGSLYIHYHPSPKQSGQIRMKHAVWVDLVNMLLWFITAIYSTLIFFLFRSDRRTLHTGRAKV
ncbi:hypothetical protein BAUCODRAFT_141621 [Baudoinia panamericana UAMH 10762]|uniref:MARVEL domain-containing protein n=1 Tax=Baudoinia panamericana (strain UAMH 10762) TaxID=717646 RepID=M2N647_BAUPA|nr:uncharacterized protein BAUCODRAFT_141621 [Baudoinia panamericana UAMH 10762]EMC94260.1 hypothetical protein BAUCODRAFT_141621 [Baudoinia panamericana UAMH 10762]